MDLIYSPTRRAGDSYDGKAHDASTASSHASTATPRVLVRLDSRIDVALPGLRYLPGLANHADVTVHTTTALYRLVISVDPRLRVICGPTSDRFDLDLQSTELSMMLPQEITDPRYLPNPFVRSPDQAVRDYEAKIAPLAAGRPRIAWLPSRARLDSPVPPGARGEAGFSWHGVASAVPAPVGRDWAELAAWLDCMHLLITGDRGFAALATAIGKTVGWTGPAHEARPLIAAGMLQWQLTNNANLPAALRSWYHRHFESSLS